MAPYLPTLLLISKRSEVRYKIKKYCESRFIVLEEESVSKGAATLLNSPVDLVILDGELDDPPLLTACKKIRAALKEPAIPILLITGRLKISFLEKALDAGVTDFLSVQFDEQEIETRLATTQRAKELREKVASLSERLRKKQ